MDVENSQLLFHVLGSAYVQFIYWLALWICWSLLCIQLFRSDEKTETPGTRFDPVPILLGLALTAARWPTLLLSVPLNPDESVLIAGALRFMHDPVPWRGADLVTSGPLNSYVLLIPAALGLDINYGTARAVGLVLLIIAVISWYLCARQVRDKFVAISVVLSPITFLCFTQDADFIHYSSELVSVALLSIAALMVSSLSSNSGVRLFIVALILGAVPFAKLQAAPLAIVAFFAIFCFAWRAKGERFSKTVIMMGAGGLTVPVLMAAVLLASGSFDDAWRSYIVSGLQLSAPMGLYRFARYLFENIAFVCSIGSLFLITIMGTNRQFVRSQICGEGRWLIAGSIAYGLTTVYAIYKPGNPWRHYLFFSLPAAVFFATAMFAPWDLGGTWQRAWARLSRSVRSIGSVATIAGAALGLLLFYVHGPFWVLEEVSMPQVHPIAKIMLALLKDDPDFAVWGWMPQYYAMTGKRPTTRDVIDQFQIWDSPQKEYYRERYLSDFNNSRPNVFVDATGPGNYTFTYPPPSPIESFPQLYQIIQSKYVLFLDIKHCRTPRTRIFVSQARLSDLSREKLETIAKQTTCLQDSGDVYRLLSLLG
jgi:hypothetical protein